MRSALFFKKRTVFLKKSHDHKRCVTAVVISQLNAFPHAKLDPGLDQEVLDRTLLDQMTK